MSDEQWRPIPGHDGYEASTNGRIRVTLTPYRDGRHYPMVTIGKASHRVHCLVALAFLGERPPGQHVCHNDGSTTNNRPDNLRYDTPSANAIDALRQDGSKRTGLCVEDIRTIRSRHEGAEPTTRIARDYGCHPSTIWRIVRRVTWAWVA